MTPPRRARLGIASLVLAVMLAAAAAGAWQPPVSAAPPAATPTPTPGAPDLVLKIISLSDNAQYPTLKACVTVWDKTTGQPQMGLTPADFSAAIELTPTTVVAVTPLTTVTQNVQVALLIDNSLTDDISLTKIKTAVSHFVDTLDPAYQVALLTAADTTHILTPLTSDREQVKAALATVPRVVTKTGLHQGLAEAVALFNAAPAAPGATRLILAITNTGDNASPTFPPDQVVSQALAASVTIHTVNFTGTDSGNSLDALARQTGGHYYALSKADQIDGALQTILSNLQQGYEVSFLSPVAGDGHEHTASLGLASAAAAPVPVRFLAPLKTVAINGPGVTEGQTVIGAVQLSTEAVVPAPPVASVEYRLDGQTFATLTTPPYTFQWDSTSVNPGSHRLKVVVRDSAGNLGEAEVTVLVALPFAVTASSDREKVAVGDKLVIRAQVSSPARIDHVEFLQGDDTLLASDATAPYECVIDTKGQAPGIKTFKVRAVDYLGRSAETDVFHIELRPTLASTGPAVWRWGLIGLNALAIVAALLIALIGSLALSARLKRQLQSLFTLEIWNEGNVRNRYGLRTEAALDGLNLEFRLQGANLPVQTLLVSPSAADRAPEPEVTPAAGGPAPQPGLSVGAVKQTGAFKSYQKVSGVGATLAGFLNTIAGLLPAGAATPLRNAATSLRQGESLSYEVDRADAQVKAVQHAGADAATSLGGSSSQPAASAPSPVSAAPTPSVYRGRPAPSETWALTPYVEPGEKLSLQMCAKPLKSTRTQTYAIRVLSRLVDVPDLAPMSEASNITVAGLTRLQRLQPFVLALVMLAVAAGLTALLVRVWGS